MTVSIVIPYRDRPEALDRTLHSIRAYFGGEVLIIDDGSKQDLGYHLARHYHAFHARLPGSSEPFRLAAARNLGAALSEGNVILFNDVDIEHQGHAAYGIEEQVSRSCGKRIVLPELHFLEGGKLRHSRERIYGTLQPGDWRESHEWVSAWLGWAAMPRSVFNAVGGFDQRYRGWGCEDLDFSCTAARMGIKFDYTRKALGIHWPHPEQPEKALTAREGERIFESKHGFPIPCEVIDGHGEILELRSKT